MTREQALAEVKKRVANRNLLKHMLAVEAIMRELAARFGEDQEVWGLAGLVHDIDYDQTAAEPDRHALVGAEILEQLGVPAQIVYAVKAHNERLGFPRQRRLDKALYAADPLSGLIVAAALIHPDKKLASITTDFVLNRFGEKGFARGANREQIASCTEFGLELRDFIDLGLRGMQGISAELGL
ncbi:MAG TPA: HDIG domain-containing protein [Firmicutes bacterium]|nr:HDIG domain-containing protein [Bacillota bacterium]